MILYFSGTGNSRYVAHRLAEELGESAPVDITSAPHSINLDHEQVIWVFPVYSWGIPPVVMRFMQNVEINGSWRHWMVCTCGDDIGLTHRQWRNIVTIHGWDAGGTFSVTMPNTYTLMRGFDVDPDDVVQKKISAATGRIHDIALCMMQGREPDDVVTGRFAMIKSKVIYPWFVRYAVSPKPFHASTSCSGCGKCASCCPLDNISIVNGHPTWGSDCALCLRCYHTCPSHAIAYGRATKNKGQYLFSEKYLETNR